MANIPTYRAGVDYRVRPQIVRMLQDLQARPAKSGNQEYKSNLLPTL